MGRHLRRRQQLKRERQLQQLVMAQQIDRAHDRLLSRVRPASQKTSRHFDDLGRTAEDVAKQEKR